MGWFFDLSIESPVHAKTCHKSTKHIEASSRNANDIGPDLLPKKANANIVTKGGVQWTVLLEARSRPSVFSKNFSLYLTLCFHEAFPSYSTLVKGLFLSNSTGTIRTCRTYTKIC